MAKTKEFICILPSCLFFFLLISLLPNVSAAPIIPENAVVDPSRCAYSPFIDNRQYCQYDAFPVCNMTTSTTYCSLSSLPHAKTISILPGNNTHCLNESAPFYFQVLPGNTEKLLIWFYGGGACWSNDINAVGSCAQSPEPGSLPITTWVFNTAYSLTSGMYNRTRNNALFGDYTIVAIHYCSGDVHAGNSVRVYRNATTNETITTVRQSGTNNTMAALNWIFENIPRPKQMIIGGCSAGSLGAQLWANYIYHHYSTSLSGNAPHTAVIADSYAVILPENQRTLFTQSNLDESPALEYLSPEQRAKLMAGDLYWCELTNYYQDQLPNVTFTAVQSAFDAVQMFYYGLIYANANHSYTHGSETPACANGSVPTTGNLTREEFDNSTLALYKSYITTGSPNFTPFIINSTQHCWLENEDVYDVNVTDAATGRVVRMVDWLERLPLGDENREISTVCDETLYCPEPVRSNRVTVV